MYACRRHCGTLSMATSAMMRVALYAGTNWRNHSGKGSTESNPKGSRNMRQSSIRHPQGKPRTRKSL